MITRFSALVRHLGYQLRTAKTYSEMMESWELLEDHLPTYTKRAYRTVQIFPHITARQVANFMNITRNNAGTVLKMLYELGMVDRYGRGTAKDPYKYVSAKKRHEIRTTKQLKLPF